MYFSKRILKKTTRPKPDICCPWIARIFVCADTGDTEPLVDVNAIYINPPSTTGEEQNPIHR